MKIVNNKIIKLAAILLIALGAGCSSKEVIENVEDIEKIRYMTENPSSQMKLVAETDYLELYISEKTAEIAVTNKVDGVTWYSNPQDVDNDAIAQGVNKSKLQSQLVITYNNSKGDAVEMNSYDFSTSIGQYAIEEVDQGVKVNYTLGKTIPEYNLPRVISEKNFNDQLLAFLTNPDQKRGIERAYKDWSLEKLQGNNKLNEYLSQYPSLETGETIYILIDNQQDFRLEQLSNYLEDVGYTKEMARQEELDNGLNKKDDNTRFNVSVTYKLEEDAFVAKVDTNDIEYNPKYPIVDIKILEYFGAANKDKEGYIFVPDASGALIYLNNNKKVAPYQGKVYGTDYAIQPKQKMDQTTQIYMPVFGMKQDEGGFIGIVEGGETVATIEADVAGRINQYNKVSTSFNILPNEVINLPSLAGMSIIKAYQKDYIQGNMQIRYKFLEKDKVNYMNMANAYREYLIAEKLLESKEIKDIPFVVEFLGGIEVDKNIVGIPYVGIEALTSYEQAQNIVQQLIDKGITGVDIKYTGMANGGIYHKIPNKINLENSLGGKTKFNQFQKFLKDNQIVLYPEFDIEYVHDDSLIDNFSSTKDTKRRIDKHIAEKATFNYVTYEEDNKVDPMPIVTFKYMDKLTKNLINSLKNKQIQGVSIANIGSDLSSDFNEKDSIDRQESKALITTQLQKFDDAQINLMSSGVNDYLLPYVDIITQMPLTSNNYNIIDEEIPFMQLVLHSYIPYTGEPLNLAQNYEYALLKTIETGAGVMVTWIGQDNHVLKETDYSQYYSVSYKDWLEKIEKFYSRAKETLGSTYNQPIIDHQQVQENVYLVEYANGIRVVVNYNDYEVNVEGKLIGSRDYDVLGGGR